MTILIVGGGKFGMKAIEYARETNQAAIVIDKNSQCQAIKYTDKQFNNIDDFKRALAYFNKNETWFIQNNVEIVNELIPLIDIGYVIPVIPIHMMVFIISTFFKKYSIDFVPEKELFIKFINKGERDPYLISSLEKSVIYLSHAKQDEICPDNCIGPPKFCPHFKREKNMTITQYLRDYFEMNDYLKIKDDDEMMIMVILESYQLKPGLGGLLTSEIIHVLTILNEKLSFISQKPCRLIIGTTCNCHGVINFLVKKK